VRATVKKLGWEKKGGLETWQRFLIFVWLNYGQADQNRIEYAGALYHITSRGNERKKIFLDVMMGWENRWELGS